jgi:hypothetical protein
LKVDLKKKRIGLAFKTYIAYSDAYELDMGDETIFNDFIDEC